MASVSLPTHPRSPSGPESRSTIATAAFPSKPENAAPARPPRSLSRSPPNINLNIEAVLRSTPRKRVTGGLALQARDSVAIRKRTMSTGVMSARVARHYARKADTELLQPIKKPGTQPATTSHRRNQSPSNDRAPGDPHISRPHSPSPSSSRSAMPITHTHLPISEGPPSCREDSRTHAPHDSQGTSTSAYPPSSPISTRSSSPSPDGSRTPSPLLLPKTPSIPNAPITSLDLDPDDVSARLRLLVNNSYFLPPAHAKPEMSPIRPSIGDIKGTTSPNAFKEFFRVGKKREKIISESGGHTNEGPRHDSCGRLLRMPSNDPPKSPLTQTSNGRLRGLRQGDGYSDGTPEECTRNRVVVVRETVEELPPFLPRPLLRPREYDAIDTAYNDPTTHYDVPPLTHFPSFAYLRIDAAGLAGNVQVDQFVPPGEPWSPMSSSPNGSGMDPQERVWRRAILEQAVDLSLSSSEAGIPEASSLIRGGRVNSEESPPPGLSSLGLVTPATPKSPKNKRSWWGRKDKGTDDTQGRPSTSSSLTDGNGPRNSGSVRSARSLDVDAQSQPSLRSKREPMIGRRILPNVHIELQEFEREEASRRTQENMELLPSLRLKPFGPTGKTSSSAPVTPFSYHAQDDPGMQTILQPPPPRRNEKRRTGSGNDVSREFIPGHSTIRKSLSSPLLSDLHETGVDVEGQVARLRKSNDSLDGVAAPSFVLQDPSGTSSLVNSNSLDSFSSGSHYDDDQEFDGVMAPAGFPEDDNASLEQYALSLANGSGRPSLDSFGGERVWSPEYHPRTSSTFGFRRSPVASVVPPSPLWEPPQGIEVDITGDPTGHLSQLARASPAPSGESRISSAKGYVSALDYTITRSSSSRRQTSFSTSSLRSTATRLATKNSVHEQNEPEMESEAPIAFFDSIQHESFMDEDGSSDSEDDTPSQLDKQLSAFSERPLEGSPAVPSKCLPDYPSAAFSDRPSETLPLSRKSMNSTRPTSAFTMQFRNASQPQLPVTRPDLPPIDTTFSHFVSYDMLDRKKPLTNIPLSAPATTSGGILSHLKGKRNKPAAKPAAQFLGIGKKRSGVSPVESLRYPLGTVFPSSTVAGMDTKTGSEMDDVGPVSSGFDAARSQRSLLSMQDSDTASLRRAGSWRSAQDESVRKLDGMMTQHLEAERVRLRKIASAVREQGGARHRE